jgi:hypothetical protein
MDNSHRFLILLIIIIGIAYQYQKNKKSQKIVLANSYQKFYCLKNPYLISYPSLFYRQRNRSQYS